jgi:tetratricopeptide (TPR) repeat protein
MTSRYKHLIPLTVPCLWLLICGCGLDPESSKRRYLEGGNKYYNNGKYKEASIMYRNALKKDMKYGEAYYRLGLASIKLGRPTDATSTLRRAVELLPENSDVYSKLIDLYLAFYANPSNRKLITAEMKDLQGRLQKYQKNSFEYYRLGGYVALTEQNIPQAVEFFTAANKLRPDDAPMVLVLAQTLAASGKAAEAETLVKSLLSRNKTYAPGYDYLYTQYRRSNRIEEAESILKSAIAALPKDPRPRLQLALHFASLNKRAEMKAVTDELLAQSKDFPNAFLDVGNFYFTVREPDTAIEVYRQGLKTQPKSRAPFEKRIIEVLASVRRFPEALNLVEQLIKADPKDNEAIAIRAGLWLQSGDPQHLRSAITDLQSVVSKMPDNHLLRFNLGNALLSNSDLGAAQVQFEESVKLRPDFVPARVALAQVFLVRREYARAQQAADAALKTSPEYVQARLVRVASLMGGGDVKLARLEVEQILKTDPNQRDAIFQLAMLDYGSRNYSAAEAGFARLHRMTPPDLRGVMGLTEVYMAQQKPDSAMQLLEKEIALQPDRIDYHVAYANVAVRSGKYDIAIREYKKYLDKLPNSPGVHLRLGETFRRKGDLNAALESFQKAKASDPKNPVVQVQLAMMLEVLGRRDEARPVYDEILQIQPDNVIALNNLAYALAEEGKDLDKALGLAERAKKVLPNDPNVADTLGWIYIRKNLSDNAIQIFNDLTAKHPTSSTFHYHLGMAYVQKGDKLQARRALDAALRNKPAKAEEEKIRALMAKIA